MLWFIKLMVFVYLVCGTLYGVAGILFRDSLLRRPVDGSPFPLSVRLLLGDTMRDRLGFLALSVVGWPYVSMQMVRVERALKRPAL